MRSCAPDTTQDVHQLVRRPQDAVVAAALDRGVLCGVRRRQLLLERAPTAEMRALASPMD
jgi:hypothetical protein